MTAISQATRWGLLGANLFLLSCSGVGQAPADSKPFDLGGTAWQLVKFQGSDDTTIVPDDKAKYTLQFASDGGLNVRIDCNRGRGTWKSSGPNKLELSILALTRAMCPPGSMHDRIVTHWNSIRSYVVKDGRLFLSVMADGGIYEFEPLLAMKTE